MLRKRLWLLQTLLLSLLGSGCTMHYKEIIIREVNMSKQKTKEVVTEVINEEVKEIFPVENVKVDEVVLTKDDVNMETGEVKRMIFSLEEVKDLITRSVEASRPKVKTNRDMMLSVATAKPSKPLSSTPPDLPLNVGKPLSLRETLLRFGGNLKDQLTTLAQMPGMLNETPELPVIYDLTGLAQENRIMQELNPYYVDEDSNSTMQERVNALYIEKQKIVDESLAHLSPSELKEAIAHYQAVKGANVVDTGSTASASSGSAEGSINNAQPEPKA